jgi:hypothetical protein
MAVAAEAAAEPEEMSRFAGNQLAALPGNATMCPSTTALAVALVSGMKAEEVRFGQLVGLAITLAIAVSGHLVLAMI